MATELLTVAIIPVGKMGFLSGRRSVDVEKHILDIRGMINNLEMMSRRYGAEIDHNLDLARAAVREGDDALARAYVRNAESLRAQRTQVQQQMVTLRTVQLQIENARSQQEIVKAIRKSREVLEEAAKSINPTEIRSELDRLSSVIDRVSLATDFLSEDISPSLGASEIESAVDRRLASIEAEVLLEREGVLPSPGSDVPQQEPEVEGHDAKIDEVIARLSREAAGE